MPEDENAASFSFEEFFFGRIRNPHTSSMTSRCGMSFLALSNHFATLSPSTIAIPFASYTSSSVCWQARTIARLDLPPLALPNNGINSVSAVAIQCGLRDRSRQPGHYSSSEPAINTGQKTLSSAIDGVPKNSRVAEFRRFPNEPCGGSANRAASRWSDGLVGNTVKQPSGQPDGWRSQRMLGLPMEDDDRPKQCAGNGRTA